MTEDATSKPALRARALAARAALPSTARAAASATIRDRPRALPELETAGRVLGYAAFGDEVDLDPLLAQLIADGVAVHLPYVEPAGIAVARVADLADLTTGYRGVREPPAGSRRPAAVEELDVALVPGVAFDHRGGRLGYGGAHFDRLLARMRPGAARIGVAFSAQMLEEIPVEPHDVRLDMVVTEGGNLRVAG